MYECMSVCIYVAASMCVCVLVSESVSRLGVRKLYLNYSNLSFSKCHDVICFNYSVSDDYIIICNPMSVK